MRIVSFLRLPVLWLAALAGPLQAATPLMIWPVDPVMGSGEQAVALWLENHGEQPVSMQVRVFTWKQNGGEDTFETQQAVVASPPIASIPPGRRQLVRLMTLAPLQPGQEHAYRVMVDELPPAARLPGEAAAPADQQVAVKVQIRYAVPLFVFGEGAGNDKKPPPRSTGLLEPRLHWHLAAPRAGAAAGPGAKPLPALCVANTGGAHARLTAASWRTAQGEKTLNAGLLGYVLAQSERCWQLEAAVPPNAALTASINGSAASIERSPD